MADMKFPVWCNLAQHSGIVLSFHLVDDEAGGLPYVQSQSGLYCEKHVSENVYHLSNMTVI